MRLPFTLYGRHDGDDDNRVECAHGFRIGNQRFQSRFSFVRYVHSARARALSLISSNAELIHSVELCDQFGVDEPSVQVEKQYSSGSEVEKSQSGKKCYNLNN